MENCTACHQGAADSSRWKTSISRAACTSCHDRTSFENVVPPGFVGHTAGPLDSDEACLGCHREGRAHIGPYEVDVTKVHVPVDAYPLRDLVANSPTYGLVLSEAPVLSGSIVQVTNLATGEYPQVTFTISVNDQPYDILASGQALPSLRFTFAAPTTDYVGYAQYTAQGSSGVTGALAATATPGEFIWTSTKTIDEIAAASGAATGGNPFPLTGTMAVGMEGRISAPATKPSGVPVASINHNMRNVVKYVALTDAQPIPRREATTVENCNTCHEDLTAHGGSRNDPEYCVMCHSAGRDTITRMPLPAVGQLARTQTLRMSYMVHAIHSGDNRANDFIAYSPYSAINFSDVRFPGDRRNCEHCHVTDQYQLPLQSGLLPSRESDIDSTSSPRTRINNYFTGATAAACTGCHDADATALHAATMSLISPVVPPMITESCVTCHASGKEFGLDTVHARLGL
jgi:OmcA/MtrC family decaheme c-type cytochrome